MMLSADLKAAGEHTSIPVGSDRSYPCSFNGNHGDSKKGGVDRSVCRG